MTGFMFLIDSEGTMKIKLKNIYLWKKDQSYLYTSKTYQPMPKKIEIYGSREMFFYNSKCYRPI